MSTPQTAPPPTAVTKAPLSKIDQVKTWLQSPKFMGELAACLPTHITPERQARILITTLTKKPELADADPASLFGAMLDCSALGLEPDGRRAHLIPFMDKNRNKLMVKLIVDYKGLIELILRSGKVTFIDAFAVYQKELDFDPAINRARFDVEYGEKPSVFHKPILVGDKGPFVGAYAVAHLKESTMPKFIWMDKGEIDTIKSRSKAKASDSGPWITDYTQMALKTCIRRISKTLPLSYEIASSIDHEQRVEARTFPTTVSSSAALVDPLRIESQPTDIAVPATAAETSSESPASASATPPASSSAPAAEPLKEKAAAATPAAATPPATTQAPAGKQGDLLEPSADDKVLLAELCVKHNLSEDKICAFFTKKWRVTPCSTIDEVFECAPRRITQLVAEFDKHLGDIQRL